MIRTIIVALFLVIFFLFSLPCYAILHFVTKVAPIRAQHASQRIVCGALNLILMVCGVKVIVIGKENIPADKTVLYIGNHTSYFDIVSTYPQLPLGVGFVAKKELDRFALLRYWLKLLRGLTFDRDDPRSGMKMILTSIEYVKQGFSMFIYPEGTRMRNGELGDFKAGSFKVATRTGCPIVPVAIKGSADIFENHIPIIRPSTVTIQFGKPVDVATLSSDERKFLARDVKSTIADMLGSEPSNPQE